MVPAFVQKVVMRAHAGEGARATQNTHNLGSPKE
jgi:hypothetical protein